MLIPFNRTVQGVFWWYPRKVVPLHRHSEKSSPSDFLEGQELLTIPSLLATHYTLHTTHYTLHTTRYSLHTTHYTLLATHYTLLTTHYTLLTKKMDREH